MSQNYRGTLNLPRADSPTKANLTACVPELLKMWQETRLYQQIQKARHDRRLFVLHDSAPKLFCGAREGSPLSTRPLAQRRDGPTRHACKSVHTIGDHALRAEF